MNTPRTPSPLPLEIPDGLVTLAGDWHGGQRSALYSLASTGAVANWAILQTLAWELRGDANDAWRDGHGDAESLAEFAAWAESLAETNPYAPGSILAASLPDTGGYNLLGVTDDGDMLCERCVTDPDNPVHPDDGSNDGWGIVGWEADGNTESEEDHPCAHCGRVILEGYGADS